jgi:hypothetical protein
MTVIDMITQYSQAQATVRTPDSDGVSQTYMINRGLIANSDVIRDKVYGLLARQAQFSPFANYRFPRFIAKWATRQPGGNLTTRSMA